jgi:hypothetical protein
VKLAAKILAAAVVPAAAITTLAAASHAQAPARLDAFAHLPTPAYTVRVIANGKNLHHKYLSNGAWKTEALTQPDDITQLGHHLFVGFQNGVGAQGEPSADGNTDSTVVEFTLSGHEIRQWDVVGKDDGNTADPLTGQVIVTVNEDANSSLYAISPRTGASTHYRYNEPLPHNGGTDAISIYRGEILVSASAPGTIGAAAPQPSYPAVYAVTLNARTRVATVHPLFSDEATATALNGASAGKAVTLGLTDPDSSAVVPRTAPAFGGDFVLDSQGDLELIFLGRSGSLSVLGLSQSVDDLAWIGPGHPGRLYTTDHGAGTVDVITGPLRAGTAYTAVTPCNANSAPSTCPAPGFPANYLGTVNTKTGTVTPVTLQGPALNPVGLIYVAG